VCGIAGVVSMDGGLEVTESVVGRMARTLHHRGPDHQGTWLAPSGRCALGHARLRIIDLSTGDQPVGNEDGSVQVVFNGEIYNFRNLRDELRTQGHEFRTSSDTEVLVHAYESWGERLVDHLEGMFTFAIWDERHVRLILARDRAGKKPLYLSRSPRGLAFGSEMKAVIAHPNVCDAIDREAIPLYLAYGYVPGARTVHRELAVLPPATVAVWEGSGAWSETRYWSPRFRSKPMSTASAVAGVRTKLEGAVARRLESDVPLGAFLSGGVDSTAIVGIMSKLSGEPVRTFSIGFQDQPHYDETRYAREAADLFGTDHTEYKVGPQAIDLVDRLVAHYDEPFGDSSAIPTYIVSQMAREHVTVVLTGDGGDELFAGYLRFQGARIAEAIPDWAGRLGGAAAKLIPHNPSFRSFSRRAERFLIAASSSPEERWLRWIGFMGRELEDVLAESVPTPERHDLLESFSAAFAQAAGPGSTSLSRALSVNFETYLPEDLLVKADRCSMAHGLELRSPFLDTALVEYASQLPDRLKIRRGSMKWVLKQAVRDLVPRSILSRGKMGFGIPLPEWLRGPWRGLLEDRLLPVDAQVGEWVRPEAVHKMAAAHLSGQADFSHQLWALLTLDSWLSQRSPPSGGSDGS
jgi:asparagine synthase (glutamine-hydrolysing)